MLQGINVKERGLVPRKIRKAMTAILKDGWFSLGRRFHTEYRDKRFTVGHAREAGYSKRKGQGMAKGSKGWRRSYYGRKFLSPEHGGGANQADPLVFSGDTRELVRRAKITSTSKGTKVRYPGARKLNFKHPKSKIRMSDEFRRVLPREVDSLAEGFDREVDQQAHLLD